MNASRRSDTDLRDLASAARRSQLWDQPERDELIATIPELVEELLERRAKAHPEP